MGESQGGGGEEEAVGGGGEEATNHGAVSAGEDGRLRVLRQGEIDRAFKYAGCEERENKDEGAAGGRQENCSEYPSQTDGCGGPWIGGSEDQDEGVMGEHHSPGD